MSVRFARNARTILALLAGGLLLSTPTSAVQAGLTPTIAPLVPNAPVEVYDPPAGTYPYFPRSVFRERIPANPAVDPNTALWLAQTGATLGRFQFAENNDGLSEDYTFPIYMESANDPNLVPVRVHCTEPWGHCVAEGAVVRVDPRALPEDGGQPTKDSHFAVISEAEHKEYDFWGTQWPPQDGILAIRWGGACSLDGDATDGCTGTATGLPLSLGVVRVKDLFAATQTQNGSLPYAIAVGVRCANGRVFPAWRDDGHRPGCPPEGARVFLDMSDQDVNASAAGALVKAMLRTIDRDHYGMVITDINGGQYEFCFQVESDLTYTTKGLPGPLVTQLLPEAVSEGWAKPSAFNNKHYLRMKFPGIDFANELKFLPVGRVTDAR
jgi:hypothetical protein